MSWPTIRKAAWPAGVVPNVVDYEAARKAFSWEAARAQLDGLPGGRGLNIAHEAVDRHAAGDRAGKVAFRWITRRGAVTEVTYAELRARTNRLANALGDLGVGPGDRVFTLLGRVPELYVTVLGTLIVSWSGCYRATLPTIHGHPCSLLRKCIPRECLR